MKGTLKRIDGKWFVEYEKEPYVEQFTDDVPEPSILPLDDVDNKYQEDSLQWANSNNGQEVEFSIVESKFAKITYHKKEEE